MFPQRNSELRANIRRHWANCLPCWSLVHLYSFLLFDQSRHQHFRCSMYLYVLVSGHHLDRIPTLLEAFKGTSLARVGPRMPIILRCNASFVSSQVPPYVLLIMSFTSYRVHSIFMLRLFNDPVAMLFFYAALYFFAEKKWVAGSIFYSYVGIK